jgi:hypothetical protein
MTLSLLSWRRAVSELYQPSGRRLIPRRHGIGGDLFAINSLRTTPTLPFRDHASGLRYRPYDSQFRYAVRLQGAEPARFEVPTTTDGIVPFTRVGTVQLPGPPAARPSTVRPTPDSPACRRRSPRCGATPERSSSATSPAAGNLTHPELLAFNSASSSRSANDK